LHRPDRSKSAQPDSHQSDEQCDQVHGERVRQPRCGAPSRRSAGAYRVRIRDTGAGISPQDKARLFQAFEQIDSTASRRHEGTGLGLYLSQKLAALLGGKITCDSEPGRGTTFTVVLPETS